MDDFFKTMREKCEAEIKHNAKLDAAYDTFCKELRSAILNGELDMTFEPYRGTVPGYFAEVTVKVYHTLTITLTLAPDFVSYGGNIWLDGLFDKPEDFQALKAMVARHIQPLTDKDKQRIRELEDEIDTIKHKYIK